MKLRVAGAQIPVVENITSNFNAINHAIDYAIDECADILLTPEGSLSGYTNQFNQVDVQTALSEIVAKASKHDLGLALGTCFNEDEGICYNQIRFYDPNGAYLGAHCKILRCGTLTDPPEGEINSYGIKPLQVFHLNGVPIGGLVCNDLWANPECTPLFDQHLTQQLSQMGVKIVFHAVNGGRDDSEISRIVIRNFHEANLRMRARAGRLWILTVDNAFPEDRPCSSPGGLISPNGQWIAQLPSQGEHFLVHTVQFD